MGTMLNRLCCSEMRPEISMVDELRLAKQELACRWDRLLAQLDEPMREKLESLLQEREEIAALEREDAYVRGTRMGAKMAMALLKSE